MIGLILSASAFFGFVSVAWTRDAANAWGSPWELLAVAALAGVLGAVLGAAAPTTVGIGAVGWQIGSALAGFICLFTGQFAYVLPLGACTFAGWAVQQVLARRVGML